MQIKALLFDKDGTLLDFGDTFYDAYARVIEIKSQNNSQLALKLAQSIGFDLSAKTLAENSKIIAGTTRDIARIWQPILGDGCISMLAQELDTLMDEQTRHTVKVLNNVHPTLVQLNQSGFKFGVATNDSENNARNHLQTVGLGSYFEFVAGYDSGFGAKPEPGMVLAFADYLDLRPSEIAMIGDSPADLIAANRAGAKAIGVRSGPSAGSDLAQYSSHILNNIDELPDWLGCSNYG